MFTIFEMLASLERDYAVVKKIGREQPGLTVYWLLLLLLACLPTTPQAAEVEVTPILGYTFGGDFKNTDNDNDLDVAEAASYGVILGLEDTTKYGAFYELYYSRQETHLKGDGVAFSGDSKFDVDISYLHIGGTYGVEQKQFHPFVSGGLGVTHMSPERGDSETKFSMSLGGGVKIPLAERISLRFEGRGFATFFDSDTTIFCNNNSCAVKIEGDTMIQFTALSGLTFRF